MYLRLTASRVKRKMLSRWWSRQAAVRQLQAHIKGTVRNQTVGLTSSTIDFQPEHVEKPHLKPVAVYAIPCDVLHSCRSV